jgi:hypothetical protein
VTSVTLNLDAHRAFFGDAEREFDLSSPALIAELERKTGVGIGALCRRLFGNDFHHADLAEIIRLALIGGGTKPEEAAALIRTYVPARPMIEAQTLAVAILEKLWFGDAKSEAA